MLHLLVLTVGIIVGILVVFTGMQALIATTRYLWKYSLGLLILFVLAVILAVEVVESERHYQEYQQTLAYERDHPLP